MFHWHVTLLLRLYERRTSAVRALSVVAGSPGRHTGHMAGEARATACLATSTLGDSLTVCRAAFSGATRGR